jgi:plasmid stabilization system protein ParE
MSAFVVAPEAEEAIFHTWLSLLREAGIETADRVEGEILEVFASLADTPGKGHRRPDLTRRKVLFYTLYAYMVVYRVHALLEIVAVLHGKRNVKRLLGRRLASAVSLNLEGGQSWGGQFWPTDGRFTRRARIGYNYGQQYDPNRVHKRSFHVAANRVPGR